MPYPRPLPQRPGSITGAQLLVVLQPIALMCFGFMSIGVYLPAFLLMSQLRVFEFVLAEPVAVPVLVAEVVGVLAYTWTVVRRIDAADARARPIVAAGIAVLAVLALGGMLATVQAGWYVAGLGPALSLATALPSLGIQVGAWALLRSRSASRWFQEHGSESEDSTR